MIAERPDLWSHVLPGVREGLAACAELLELGIVSNSNGTVEQLLRDEAICQVGPGPGVVVTCVVDSEVVGVAKPDPRVFGPAVAALRVRADNVAYVGDTRAFDLAGARAAGLTGIHVDPLELCPQRADHHHVHDLGEVAPLLARRAMASTEP
nr:HAD family hydrolase [Actinopolymorpha rutila]